MTDLWRDYFGETYGREVIYASDDKGPAGLIAWQIEPNGDFYITDVFTRKDVRRTGMARDLFYAVRSRAEAAGARRILGTIDVTRSGWRESVAAQEAVGFVLAGHNDRGQALLVYTLEGGE